MRVKQISLDEALDMIKNSDDCYVIKLSNTNKKPIGIKSFKSVSVGDMTSEKLAFIKIEED